MKNSYRFSPFPLIAFFLSSCGTVTIPVTPTFHEGSRADGVVKIAVEFEPDLLRTTEIPPSTEGPVRAKEICRGWGYKDVVYGGETVQGTNGPLYQGITECIQVDRGLFGGSTCSKYRVTWTYICTSRRQREKLPEASDFGDLLPNAESIILKKFDELQDSRSQRELPEES